MIQVLFTDTHFGVRQNSITWLNSQKQFIYNQFIPYIEKLNKDVQIVHLGDVFDSRSSISTLIATEVVNIFKNLSELKNVKEILIIAGNHDFYSPNSDEIDSLHLYLNNIDKTNIISKQTYRDGNNLYVPWYCWFDQGSIQSQIDIYNINKVFTHADIVSSPVNLVNTKVLSGHTHIPFFKNNLLNLGSCYPLNFADSNQSRGFYIIDEGDKLDYIANTESIRFWRLYNEDIFKNNNIKEDDYIELYINQNNLSDVRYNEKISEFLRPYKNIRVIPQISEDSDIEFVDFKEYNIESITKNLIPDELKDKFNRVLEVKKNY